MTAEWLIGAIATGILGLIWWDIRSFKKWVIKEVDGVKKTHKKALYHQDGPEHGLPIYMSRTACEREQGRCQKSITEALTGIRSDLATIEGKREESHTAMLTSMGKVGKEMAGLRERLNAHIDKGPRKDDTG